MFISISGNVDPRKYKWFAYNEHKVITLKGKFGRDVLELEIDKGSHFGLRQVRNKWRLLDPDDLSGSFVISDFDAARLINNSKGWTGKVWRYKVDAGEGKRDTLTKFNKSTVSKGRINLQMNSSMFSRGLYDAKKKELYLVFKNGAVWRYQAVTRQEIKDFQTAYSQGRWYNENIKGVKDGQRLDSFD